MKTSRTRDHILLVLAIGVLSVSSQSGISQTKTRTKAGTNRKASLEFKGLLELQAALKRIPWNKQNKEPYRTFLKRNEKKIVYSDPSAEYYVRSEQFWALRKKYSALPIADDIAWAGAKNTLPGECEGYLSCYLDVIRSTDIEYLSFYPNGTHSKRPLQDVINGLTSTVADLGKNEVHTGPADASERVEMAKVLAEMHVIVSKVSHPEKMKLLLQLERIGNTYK